MRYIKYKHWPNSPEVFVREDLKGTHRDICLCYSCGRFTPEDRKNNCPRANELYSYCVRNDMTTPVLECPEFVEI